MLPGKKVSLSIDNYEIINIPNVSSNRQRTPLMVRSCILELRYCIMGGVSNTIQCFI